MRKNQTSQLDSSLDTSFSTTQFKNFESPDMIIDTNEIIISNTICVDTYKDYDQASYSSGANSYSSGNNCDIVSLILDSSTQDSEQSDYNNYVIDSLTKIKKLSGHLSSKNYSDQLRRIMSNDKIKNYRFDEGKPLLALDLDETLIHSELLCPNSFSDNNNFDYILPNINTGVYARPHLNSFLFGLKNYFNIILFTAGTAEYADAILAAMNLKNSFDLVLTREFCVNINGRLYIKDLSIFGSHQEILIVDNSIYSFAKHLKNGILIDSFFNDKTDTELVDLLEYLVELTQLKNNELSPSTELTTEDPVPILVRTNENHFYFERIYNCIDDI